MEARGPPREHIPALYDDPKDHPDCGNPGYPIPFAMGIGISSGDDQDDKQRIEDDEMSAHGRGHYNVVI